MVRADQSGHHVKGGCLACTVWAQEPHDFAWIDSQADFVDDLAASIGFLESFDFQEWGRGGTHRLAIFSFR